MDGNGGRVAAAAYEGRFGPLDVAEIEREVEAAVRSAPDARNPRIIAALLEMLRLRGADPGGRPIVTLCGSLRFAMAYRRVNLRETFAGNIVLAPACPDKAYCDSHSEEQGEMLDAIHRAKIAMSARVVVVRVGGYVGEATRDEVAYAESIGVPVEYADEPDEAEAADILAVRAADARFALGIAAAGGAADGDDAGRAIGRAMDALRRTATAPVPPDALRDLDDAAAHAVFCAAEEMLEAGRFGEDPYRSVRAVALALADAISARGAEPGAPAIRTAEEAAYAPPARQRRLRRHEALAAADRIAAGWADLGVDPHHANVVAALAAALRAGAGGMERAARLVERFAEQYPPDVFPADGASRDAIAGTALRRMLPSVAGAIRVEADVVRAGDDGGPLADGGEIDTWNYAGPVCCDKFGYDPTAGNAPSGRHDSRCWFMAGVRRAERRAEDLGPRPGATA